MKILLYVSKALSVCFLSVIIAASLSISHADSIAANANGQNLVVVELFTSQGCNSCPPADAVLADFSTQENVLALSYSIDYWDYLGWKDTLGQPECTARQKKYNATMGKSGVYTPQMIIQGSQDLIGSQGGLADEMVKRARQNITELQPAGFAMSFEYMDEMIDLKINASANDGKVEKAATIWIIGYDFEETVTIDSGELKGQTRKYHNVVKSIKRIGSWMGEEIKLTLSKQDLGDAEYDAYAVLLQHDEIGPIIAAARIE